MMYNFLLFLTQFHFLFTPSETNRSRAHHQATQTQHVNEACRTSATESRLWRIHQKDTKSKATAKCASKLQQQLSHQAEGKIVLNFASPSAPRETHD